MEQKYIAFISYRHAPLDQAVAKELHSRIEQFTIPKGLRKNGKKLGRVFRDLEELPASSNLSDDIYKALDNSENLIVVCSREMAQSPWVAREVEYFLQHHPQENVYTVLSDGEPAEVFPKALLTKTLPGGAVVDVEPLAVDVRSDSKTGTLKKLGREMNRLLAAMIGCPYDALVQRQQKRQRRRLLLGAGAVLTVAMLFSGMMLVKNQQIDAKNEELEKTNQQLEEQKAQLQLNESELLTGQANQYLKTGELGLALPYALDALSNADGSSRPYYAPAEQALIASLSVFDSYGQNLLVDKTLTQTTPVENFVICKEGSRLITIDPYNVLRCFDTVSQQQLWQAQASSDAYMFGSDDRLLVQTRKWLVALDVETGVLLWETTCTYQDTTLSLEYSSVDGDRWVVVGSYMSADYTQEYYLLITVDPATGETLWQQPLTQGQSLLDTDGYPYVQIQQIGAFSEDGRYFAGCWKQVKSSQEAWLHFYVADLVEQTWQEMYSLPVESYSAQVYRMAIDGDAVYVLRNAEKDDALAVLDAWSIQSKSLLWQMPCQPEESFSIFGNNYHITFTKNACAVSCGKYLFWMMRSDGKVLAQGQMDSDIVLLEAREGGVFQIALMDGRLGYVWPNSSGTISSSLPVTLYRTEQFQLHADGFLRLAVENSRIGDMSVDGGGYTACVRQEDERVITITKAVQAGAYFPRQEVEIQLESSLFLQHHTWEIGEGKLILGPLDLYRQEPPYQQFLLFDLANPQEQTSLYAGSRYALTENLFFTADGKYCLECDGSGNIYWYDTSTGQQTVLSQRDAVELVTMGDTVYTASRYLSAGCVRYDGVTLAVRLEESGLTLWLDGVEQTAPKPEGAVLQMQSTAISRFLWVGENGCVVVSGFEDADQAVDFFWVYDTISGQWHRLEAEAELTNPHMSSSAGKNLVLADGNGVAWIYDLETLNCQGSFSLLIPRDAIQDMKLVQQDRFLLVQTSDRQMIVYRLSDGQIIYQRKLTYSNKLQVTEDGKGRLYIHWSNGGLCLDGESWQELAEIPKLIHFDAATGQLLSVDYAQDSFDEVLVIQRLPDLEELIRIGRELLNSQ